VAESDLHRFREEYLPSCANECDVIRSVTNLVEPISKQRYFPPVWRIGGLIACGYCLSHWQRSRSQPQARGQPTRMGSQHRECPTGRAEAACCLIAPGDCSRALATSS
jgi:hypothetical protein